jgi:ankyrin repeat domain-containing protein 50
VTSIRKDWWPFSSYKIQEGGSRDIATDNEQHCLRFVIQIPFLTEDSSAIIDHLVKKFSGDSNIAIGYFFFDFADIGKHLSDKLLRSLILQLSTESRTEQSAIVDLYTQCKEFWQPTSQQLVMTLYQLVKQFPQTYLVIDALDECTDRDELLTILSTIAE